MKRSFVILLGLLTLTNPAQTSRIAPELCELLASPTHGPKAFSRVFHGLHAAQNWYKIPRATRSILMERGLVSHLDPQTAQDLMGVMSARHRSSFMDQRPSLTPTARVSLDNRKRALSNLMRNNRTQWPYCLMDKHYDTSRQLMVDFCQTARALETPIANTLPEMSEIKVMTVTTKAQQELVFATHMSLKDAHEFARRQFFRNNRLSRNTLIDRALLRFWTWETMLLGHMLDGQQGFSEGDPRVCKIIDQELARKFTALSSTRSSIMVPMIDHIDRLIQGEKLPPYSIGLDQGVIPVDYEIMGRPDLLPKGYEDEAQHRQGGLDTFFETFEIRT